MTAIEQIRAELEAAGKSDHYLSWCIGATSVKSLPREQIPIASTTLAALLDVAEAMESVQQTAEHYRATCSATSRDWAVAGTFLAIAKTALGKLPQK